MLRHGAVATLILAVGLGSSARREDELVVFVHGWKAGGQTVKRLLNATVGPRHIVSAFAGRRAPALAARLRAHAVCAAPAAHARGLRRVRERRVRRRRDAAVRDVHRCCASRARARYRTSTAATRGRTTSCAAPRSPTRAPSASAAGSGRRGATRSPRSSRAHVRDALPLERQACAPAGPAAAAAAPAGGGAGAAAAPPPPPRRAARCSRAPRAAPAGAERAGRGRGAGRSCASASRRSA